MYDQENLSSAWTVVFCFDCEVEDCGLQMVTRQGDEHDRYSRAASAGTEL